MTAFTESPSRILINLISTRRTLLLSAMTFVVVVFALGTWAYSIWRVPQPDEVLQIATGQAGQKMPVDVFWPTSREASKRCSAIVLLPGVEGAKHGAYLHYPKARQLADEGHTVFVAHYLEPCGYDHLYYLNDDGSLDTDSIDEVILRDREKWIDGVTDVISEIARRPEIDSERIGLLGYSLGCFVEISVADRANKDVSSPNIAALVGNWGAKFEDVEFDSSVPPCRFFHGGRDEIVPVAWAQKTVAELNEVNDDVQLRVFSGEGHVVKNPLAWQLTMEFFRSKLSASIPQQWPDQSEEFHPITSVSN